MIDYDLALGQAPYGEVPSALKGFAIYLSQRLGTGREPGDVALRRIRAGNRRPGHPDHLEADDLRVSVALDVRSPASCAAAVTGPP